MEEIINIIDIVKIVSKKNLLERDIISLNANLQSIGSRLTESYREEEFNSIKNEEFLQIINEIEITNKNISSFNNYLKRFRVFWKFKNIVIVDLKEIKSIIKNIKFEKRPFKSIKYLEGRLKDLKKTPPKFSLREENFIMKVQKVLNETINSLRRIFDLFFENSLKFRVGKLEDTKYEKFVLEVNCLFSLGYPPLALFIMGRTLERIILDFMISLRKRKKIDKTYFQINNMNSEDRLNYLKGRWISEKDYHKINSIKFDRNIVAHYPSKKDFLEVQKDAESNIKIAMNLANKIYSKIKI